jgi:SET domain-containing protein
MDTEQQLHRESAPYPSQAVQTSIGLGLIATANLESETVVEKFEGPAVRYAQIPEDEIRYALLIRGNGWVIPQTNARYINHSCEANCYVSETREVVTTRHVSRGEELTIVYNGITMERFLKGGAADNFWDDRRTFSCRCGAPRCVGLIDRYVATCADDSNSRNVYLGVTKRKGRGVFARRRISAGETIETANVLVVPASQWFLVAKSVLYDYTFEWGWDGEDAALAMGYGSFYNHSYAPNARYERRLADVAIDIVALHEIEQAQEIVINYNGHPENREPLWFPIDT